MPDKKYGNTPDWIKQNHAAGGHCSYCGNTAVSHTTMAGSGQERATCKNCSHKPNEESRFNSGADR